MFKLQNIKYTVIALKYLITEEKNYKAEVSVIKKIKLLSRGFTSEKYNLYELYNNDIKQYLSDFQRRKTEKINDKYTILLDDKYIFETLLKDKNIVPKTFGTINKRGIFLENKEANINLFIKLLKEQKALIIKKQQGGGGKGIYRLEYSNGNIVIDDTIISKEKFNIFSEALDDSLITEHLQQAHYSNSIYPGTINTIRILVMKDPDTNRSFIATAIHKFGSKKTEPVDNVWGGGVTALVDLETGVLGRPALHNENNKKIEWIEKHPDTQQVIKNIQIPHWREVKSSILSLTDELKNIQYVGWDVVITNDGFKIIEGNNYSDVNIIQIHQPLLKGQRVKKFYKYHNII